jgi:hypothetical protein
VRSGAVRVLIGSTQKMGTGTNVQRRLVALHHLDAPWKPAEVEQREGRILRQGNSNEEVAIYRYVTEGSFDAYMWQALETKARFISQVMTGEAAVRRAEDIGGQELSYAEVKAIASGNPAVLTLAEADTELQRLAILRKNHADEQYIARRSLRDLPETIARLTRRIAGLTADLATATAHAGDPLMLDERACHRDDVQTLLGNRLDALPIKVREMRRVPLGVYQGLRFGMVLKPNDTPDVYLEGAIQRHVTLAKKDPGPRAVMNAVERLAGTYADQADEARQELGIAKGQLRDYQARLDVPFSHEGYFDELTALRDQLKTALSSTNTGKASTAEPSASEIAERIKALKAAHSVETVPERTARRCIAAEQPVTARIRQRWGQAPAAEPPATETTETIEHGGAATPEETPVQEPMAAVAAPSGDGHAAQMPTIPLPERPQPASAAREPVYHREIAAGRRAKPRQLSLF